MKRDSSTFSTMQSLRTSILDGLKSNLTLGIGLYDDRKVAIRAYNQTGAADHIAMLISTNQTVVDWTLDLYNTYWDRAHRKTERTPEAVGG
ncbi:DUF1724 domain-containing protein [Halomicroarcula sp. F27]|uniref:DUF1724 domain-containing protein n=1 Tax=Haloarcula nitratireducens TaxID=2487749 RepID=A0AAW4PHL6_9EURY|nr:DUF1724 domain-containing protein [Halomicroarcula nitratireducens]